MENKILQGVNDYYTKKIDEHGISSKGVDWNSKESQYVRFQQLCKLIDFEDEFSVLDYGCGYGELVYYLQALAKNRKFRYDGYDVSERMIENANSLFNKLTNVCFSTKLNASRRDFVLASGIFNVKLDLASNVEWFEYILETLQEINGIASRGFSFNALTKYSDKEYMKDYLYYSDPLFLFDYCKKNFGRNVSLLHDYNLYEFTLIVRK